MKLFQLTAETIQLVCTVLFVVLFVVGLVISVKEANRRADSGAF